MGLLNKLGFGTEKKNVAELMKAGAIVVDVRSPSEYQIGHVKSSKNIPLDTLETRLIELQSKYVSIIFCCASGMRSSRATKLAKSKGIDAYNGGGWTSLNALL